MFYTLFATLFALTTSAHAVDLAGPHDLQFKKVAVVRDANGGAGVTVSIVNVGPSFSESGDVRLIGTKSGDYTSCKPVIISGGFNAIPAGGTRNLTLTMPRGNWNTSSDASLFLFIDASNFTDEPDEGRGDPLTEANNAAVIAVKRGNGNVTSVNTSAFRTPECVLDEVANEFTLFDAFPKLWVKAEIMN